MMQTQQTMSDNKNCLKLLILAFLLIICGQASAKIYLVSVGIANYPGTELDLTLPDNDAKTITWLYSKNSDVEYKQLLNSQATRSNIVNAITTLFDKASETDIVVLFFSGHGYPGGFLAYDDNLSYSQIRKAMAKSRSKNKMIFADACFSGKLRESGRHNSSSSAINSAKKANVMLFLSSRSNESSLEIPSMKNGFFTTYLQRGLRGNADANRDRTITAKELFDFVSTNVIKISKGKQHPVMWGKFSDDMPVMVW